MHVPKTALISVYDKRGIVDFAKALVHHGIRIISTGNTARVLRNAGIKVCEVGDYTGFPEMLEGRVKTLHPKIHAGILARRDKAAHRAQLTKHGIPPIDIIVANLYPFEEVVRKRRPFPEIVENIDIGGPTLLRAAAKNFESVLVVSSPDQYSKVIEELRAHRGMFSVPYCEAYARRAFETTAAYDAAISNFFNSRAAKDMMPEKISLSAAKVSDLRYGENPHQKGAWYSLGDRSDKARIAGFTRLQGKTLSFNNILDLDIARQIVRSLESCACVIIKHNNPCGVAEARTLRKAFLDAFASDPLSAFGGVIGFNKKVDGSCAAAILTQGFVECVMAPAFSAEARRIFSQKKNLILVTALSRARKEPLGYDIKKTEGGFLVQDKDTRTITASRLKIVSGKRPTRLQERSLLFAWQVAKFVKSNAIVIAKDTATVGIGMGQTSRVDSVFMALKKAGPRARGACMASDGFFPKPDSIVLAAKAGVAAVIQPGGSVKDNDVIKEASRHGIRMVMTGIRHFRH